MSTASEAPHSVGRSEPHESAEQHVCGSAQYIDDMPQPSNLLHTWVGQADIAHGKVSALDLSKVRSSPGVVAVITADDIPGHKDIGPVFPGDPLFVESDVSHWGQPLFAVAAETREQARAAAAKAKVIYQTEPPVVSLEQAMEADLHVRPPHQMQRGDVDADLAKAPHQITNHFDIGGQEHFYLEGQIACVHPEEDGGVTVYTSNQNPTETQKLVAEVLAIPMHAVTAVTRRMGGGFGGKETHAAPWACIAALLAVKTGRAVMCRLSRRDDFVLTGKRHGFHLQYDAGFDQQGHLLAVRHRLAGHCGHSPDLSDAIVDRAMFHCDNAYFAQNIEVTGLRHKSHTVSNTAFRGFGGPQGVIAAEHLMDDIARALGEDPLTIRQRNLYADAPRNVTQYHQTVEHTPLARIFSELAESSEYWQRREKIRAYNAQSPVIKYGLALTPVKFGISFTVEHLNQAGALLHIYSDGSVALNHGGTEMGQGLFTKVAQIVAEVFQIPLSSIRASATRTDKVPNTSATAASSGTDLNGMAAKNAAETLKQRLVEFSAGHYGVSAEQVVFAPEGVHVGEQVLPFSELAETAYRKRVPLSTTGFYRTPKIHYDRSTAQGRPFFYYACGAAVTEVAIDTLTGEYKALRTDILHDVGNSINPALDIGQIEGAFVQGLGWLTCEELRWDDKGRLLTTGPATYKIPAVSDPPPIMNVQLLQNSANAETTVYHSKAVGEPPFMLAISAWCAIKDAISALTDYRVNPKLDAPATPERILAAIDALD